MERIVQPRIKFFSAENDILIRIRIREIDAAVQNNYIIGIVQGGMLRKIYDRNQQLIKVRLPENINIAINNVGARNFPFNQPYCNLTTPFIIDPFYNWMTSRNYF